MKRIKNDKEDEEGKREKEMGRGIEGRVRRQEESL